VVVAPDGFPPIASGAAHTGAQQRRHSSSTPQQIKNQAHHGNPQGISEVVVVVVVVVVVAVSAVVADAVAATATPAASGATVGLLPKVEPTTGTLKNHRGT